MKEKTAPAIIKNILKPKHFNPFLNIFLISITIFSLLVVISSITGRQLSFLNLIQKKRPLQTVPQESLAPYIKKNKIKPSPRPLPHGKHGFTVRGGNRNAPQFGQGFLDPIDPKEGTKQKIIINVSNSSPINYVNTVIKTDNKQTPIRLNLSEGTNTNGTWEGTWTVNDTYLYNYRVIILASANNGKQKVEITLR